MSGIYIPMKPMPKCCGECSFCIECGGYHYCTAAEFTLMPKEYLDTKHACCPLIPAADVVEVKRGKWSVHEIYKHEMSYGATAYEPVYKCSACGNLMESYLRYDKPIMPEDADFPRFCPNCGAQMVNNDGV